MPKKQKLERYAVTRGGEVLKEGGEPRVVEWDGVSDHQLDDDVELVKLVPPHIYFNLDLPGVDDQPHWDGPGVKAND